MKKRLLMVALAVGAILPTMASEVENLADSARVYDLDEVVVVSQAKEFYRLRQQPVSSTVLTSNEISRLGVRDLRELSQYVPSFVMPNYGSRFTSSIYVRGIGSRVNSPSMGVYIDDMPLINKTAFNTHLYETERVDVLRGPQGTLYGINTEGGMVRMYTRNPMNYQGTDINLSLGSHFHRKAEVAHYNKGSDQFAFSVAAFYTGENGFFRNQTTGERADNGDEAGGRLRLIFQPTDRLSFNYVADYQFVKQKAYPYGVLNDELTEIVGQPNQDSQSRYKRNLFNTGLDIKYVAKGFDFNSTTSYQFLRDNLLMDNDYSAIDFIVVDQFQLSNALTQEFSFKSNNTSRWHWTSGVFGSYSWLKTVAPNTFGTAFSSMMGGMVGSQIYNAMFNSMAARMGEAAAKAAIERAGGINVNMGLFVPCTFRTPQFNLGIYHESNIDLTDNFTATLGLRYDFTHSEIDYDTRGDAGVDFNIMGVAAKAKLLSIFKHEEKADFSQLLPKFGLTYKFDGGSNVYATVAKGYRAGGFNVQLFGDYINTDVQKNLQTVMGEAQQTRQDVNKEINHTDAEYEALLDAIKFKPEESWNYELGTHLNLFGDALHADLSVFYMQIRNQQLSVFNKEYGFGRRMVNAGKSYSCGLELSLRGSLVNDHLTWAANYGYTNAKFKEYVDQDTDYKDNYVPFIPAHTFSAMADYRFDFSGSLLKDITVGANVNGQGKIWWDDANTFSQKLYAVLGAHAAANFGCVNVDLWARNITDTKYGTFAFRSAATGKAVYSAQRGMPFQMGVDVKIHF